MLHQEFGSLLLGFTGKMSCTHCKNQKPMQVRQDYAKQSVFLVPLPTAHKRIYLMCSVCEKETKLTLMPRFAGSDTLENIRTLLDEGKEYTKYWTEQLSHKEKEALFKRLNSIKAYNLVQYLGT